MPSRSAKACERRGCGRAFRGLGRFCPEHAGDKAYDKARGSAHARGYGRTWEKLRKLVLHRDPVCKVCSRRASTVADHIIRKRDGGPNTLANLQGLCKPCHDEKTRRETNFGGGWIPE